MTHGSRVQRVELNERRALHLSAPTYQKTCKRDDPDVKEKGDGWRPLHEVDTILGQPVK